MKVFYIALAASIILGDCLLIFTLGVTNFWVLFIADAFTCLIGIVAIRFGKSVIDLATDGRGW